MVLDDALKRQWSAGHWLDTELSNDICATPFHFRIALLMSQNPLINGGASTGYFELYTRVPEYRYSMKASLTCVQQCYINILQYIYTYFINNVLNDKLYQRSNGVMQDVHLIHWGRMTHICVSKLCHCLVMIIACLIIACLTPSHFLKQSSLIVDWAIRNIFQWNLNWQTRIFHTGKWIWKCHL